jgi:hypothetical protein
MRLISMMASMCAYAQEHWEEDFKTTDVALKEERMAATSFAVACFLALNTVQGNSGVEGEVVLVDLIGKPKTEAQWRKIIGSLVREYGGLKKKGRRRHGRV